MPGHRCAPPENERAGETDRGQGGQPSTPPGTREAAHFRSVALAMLAGDYASRIALAQAAGGPNVAAAIDALRREQQAAEWALAARLAAERQARRSRRTGDPARPGDPRRSAAAGTTP